MTKQVLIVSHRFDLHVDLIEPVLASKDCLFFRINLDCFPKDYQLYYEIRNQKLNGYIRHNSSGKQVNLENIGAIWLRKPASYSFDCQDLTPQEEAFAHQETEHALFSVLYSLNCYWISHPANLRGAMWKGEQLVRAAQYGFEIPDSVITNSASEVRGFKSQLKDQMIFKTLSSPHLAAELVTPDEQVASGLHTTIITDDMLNELDSVDVLPCHFQEYIPKQYELRVTVIADQLYAAKIYSQDDVRTAVDSRDISADIRYEATTLPDDIAQRCLQFVKSYGLNFSALDIIVTPDNQYVFLENNPNGQFLYIEQLVPELRLMDAMAIALAREAGCRCR